GLLAVAALGVVLAWRFNASLDVALAPLALDSRAAAAVAAERGKMGAAAFPADLEPSVLEALRRAFDLAYIAGFRAVMIGCAVLASLGALAAALLVGSPRIPPPGSAAE